MAAVKYVIPDDMDEAAEWLMNNGATVRRFDDHVEIRTGGDNVKEAYPGQTIVMTKGTIAVTGKVER